jgi:hypothetical protein
MNLFGIHRHDWAYREDEEAMIRECDRCGQIEEFELTDADLKAFLAGEA